MYALTKKGIKSLVFKGFDTMPTKVQSLRLKESHNGRKF